MAGKGNVLLINPWIYDFAAYNLWIEPLGLLTLAAVLRDNGYWVTVVDCLAPHPGMPQPRLDGSGKFLKTEIAKPTEVAMIPRRYGRYGLPLEQFKAVLTAAPRPDLVLVASGMTYWYPGVIEAIQQVRARWGAVPVALGGTYATLCPNHARQFSGADEIFSGPAVVAALRLADQVTGHDSEPERYEMPSAWPPPARELVQRPFAGLITSWGCPYRCTYCASSRLHPAFVQREPTTVVSEIGACLSRGIHHLAFYDDALLVNADQHLVPILKEVIDHGWQTSFHTPNGLHAGAVTPSLAVWMRRAGFVTVRLSLETIDLARQRRTGGKVTLDQFERAVWDLRAAGFRAGELGAYVLAGLPDQPLSEVEETVRFVHRCGVQAQLALFSPIPGTPDGDRALPPQTDPLWHNDTVYPYRLGDEYVRELQRIKQLAKEGNQALKRRNGP